MRTSTIQIVAAALLIFSGTAYCADLSGYEATCLDLGFKKRTSAFGACVLELDKREVDQQRQQVEQQRQQADRIQADQQRAERQRQANEQEQRNEEQARKGDGSPDHQNCYRYGFKPGTPSYGQCRQQFDMARKDAERKQVQYEQQQAQYAQQKEIYDEQVAAAERERQRQRGLKQMELGLRMMGGTSPNFGTNVGNAAAGTMGIAPIAPQAPAPPAFERYSITMPGGRTTNCTYSTAMRSMNCF